MADYSFFPSNNDNAMLVKELNRLGATVKTAAERTRDPYNIEAAAVFSKLLNKVDRVLYGSENNERAAPFSP